VLREVLATIEQRLSFGQRGGPPRTRRTDSGAAHESSIGGSPST